MMDIEEFSFCCWATRHCLIFNKNNRRGIIYRGYATICNPEWFAPHENHSREVKPLQYVSTWGT